MSTCSAISQLFWARLCAGRCVAFLGAGFSLPAGYPTWREMVERLLERAHSDGASHKKPVQFQLANDFLKNGEYALAADVLVREELLETQERSRVLESFFSSPRLLPVQMKRRLDALVAGPWAGMVTTNYDRLIEEHIGHASGFRKIENAGPVLGNVLSDPRRFFAKLHGESWKERCVLTTEDYHRTYLREPFLERFLEGLMLTNHLVFIGCSLENELIRMRVRLCDEFKQQLPRAYALLPRCPETERRQTFLEKYAEIDCWLYDPADIANPDHGNVDAFLEDCAQCTDLGEDPDANKRPVWERLQSIGRTNRMLLRAVLACNNGRVELSVFCEADSLQRRQASDAWIGIYYAHMTNADLLSRARRFIAADLLIKSESSADALLEGRPNLADELGRFDLGMLYCSHV